MPPPESHERLARHVALARAGDVRSRELLAERAHLIALKTAVALTGSRELAAEIAQEVALLADSRLGRLRDPRAFDAWVHRTSVREALRAQRRNVKRGARTRSLEDGVALVGVTAEMTDDVESRLVLGERIASLPPRQRAAPVLRYVHDLPDEELAQALGCRVGTVHALLSRARATLREDPSVRALAAAPLKEAI